MKTTIEEVREIIRSSIISEIDIEELGDVCFAAGSTHVMKTCKIGEDKYFLKFSDESLFNDVDPSLQVLVEYLAYQVYVLYKNINVPDAQLVYDKSNKKVGIATSAVKGKMALSMSSAVDYQKFGRMMSSGVYVDIFLANWDVIGTGSGNVIIDKDKATRIDPGGSLTFRAMGDRKGTKFNTRAGELKTMLDSSISKGAGRVFQYSDLIEAASTFFSVSWKEIQNRLTSVGDDVSEQLIAHGLVTLEKSWTQEVRDIVSILSGRHKEVSAHARHIAEE